MRLAPISSESQPRSFQRKSFAKTRSEDSASTGRPASPRNVKRPSASVPRAFPLKSSKAGRSSTAILEPKAAISQNLPRGPLLRLTSPLKAPPKTRALKDRDGPDNEPRRNETSLRVIPGTKSRPARLAFPCSHVVGAVNGPNTLLNFPACTVRVSRRRRPCASEFNERSKPSRTWRKFSPSTSADPFRISMIEGQAPPGAKSPNTLATSSKPALSRWIDFSGRRKSITTFTPSAVTE